MERVGCASSGPVSTQWVMASEQSLPWRSSMFCTKLISDISIYIYLMFVVVTKRLHVKG